MELGVASPTAGPCTAVADEGPMRTARSAMAGHSAARAAAADGLGAENGGIGAAVGGRLARGAAPWRHMRWRATEGASAKPRILGRRLSTRNRE